MFLPPNFSLAPSLLQGNEGFSLLLFLLSRFRTDKLFEYKFPPPHT